MFLLSTTEFIEPDLLPPCGQCPHRGKQETRQAADLVRYQGDSSTQIGTQSAHTPGVMRPTTVADMKIGIDHASSGIQS